MKRWVWLSLVVLVVAALATFAGAQTRLQPRVLSGDDVGFRIEGINAMGRPFGRWVIRVNGEWVEVGSQPAVHRLR